jgi:hypothetical protein
MAEPTGKRRWLKIMGGLTALVVIVALARCYWPVHVDIDMTGPVAGWTHYGQDAGGTRYSPLDQITPENVRNLEVAWTYNTGDVSDGRGGIPSTTAFEATPILVEDLLVFPTPFNRIIALDPETGEERWVYDPEIDLSGRYANQLTSRGVEYWEDSTSTGGYPGPLDGDGLHPGPGDGRAGVPGRGTAGAADHDPWRVQRTHAALPCQTAAPGPPVPFSR